MASCVGAISRNELSPQPGDVERGQMSATCPSRSRQKTLPRKESGGRGRPHRHAYFRDRHAPMFAELLGDNRVRFEVHRALRNPDGPRPPFPAATCIWVTSAEEFGAALA